MKQKLTKTKKGKVYIIPGLGESCNEKRYVHLQRELENVGYNVCAYNPNWYLPLSTQIFRPEKNATIIGFSFGAVLVYLIGMAYPFHKAVFASLSPIHTFTRRELITDYAKHMPMKDAVVLANDIKGIHIDLKKFKIPFVTMAGEKENLKADVLVPKTAHRMTPVYIQAIKKNI